MVVVNTYGIRGNILPVKFFHGASVELQGDLYKVKLPPRGKQMEVVQYVEQKMIKNNVPSTMAIHALEIAAMHQWGEHTKLKVETMFMTVSDKDYFQIAFDIEGE